MQNSNTKVDPSTGQFIDPMFAVIIAAAVSETFVVWVKQTADVPNTFGISIVAIGYINLLLSWFGYHKSVHKRPIKGSVRFIVTVVLLPAYLLTIIMWNKAFHAVALTYALIFFLWSAWERLKFAEYPNPEMRTGFWALQSRFFNLLVYFAAAYAFAVEKYLRLSYTENWFVRNADELSMLMIVAAIFILRVSKSEDVKRGAVADILSGVRTLFFGPDGRSGDTVNEQENT